MVASREDLEARVARLEEIVAELQKQLQVATLPDGPPDPGKTK